MDIDKHKFTKLIDSLSRYTELSTLRVFLMNKSEEDGIEACRSWLGEIFNMSEPPKIPENTIIQDSNAEIDKIARDHNQINTTGPLADSSFRPSQDRFKDDLGWSNEYRRLQANQDQELKATRQAVIYKNLLEILVNQNRESNKSEELSQLDKVQLIEKVRRRDGVKNYEEAIQIASKESGQYLYKNYNSFKKARNEIREYL